MALSVQSLQSQELIDVSQNAQSPISSPARKENVPPELPDKGEESLNTQPRAEQARAVEPSQPRADDDDDDLYTVSPKAKTITEAAMSAREASTRLPDIESRGGPVSGAEVAESIDRTTKLKVATRNAIDDLLENGATARPAQIEQHQAKMNTRQKEASLTVVESTAKASVAASNHVRTSVRSRFMQTSSKAAPQSAPPAAGSAAAALRAKKQGGTPGSIMASPPAQDGLATAASKAKKPHPSMVSALREQGANARTPAPPQVKAAARTGATNQSVTGKLTLRKLGMFEKTPQTRKGVHEEIGDEPRSAATTHARKAKDTTSRGTKPANKDNDASGGLRRPNHAAKGAKSAVAGKSIYDIPDERPKRAKPSNTITNRATKAKPMTKPAKTQAPSHNKAPVVPEASRRTRARPKKVIASSDSVQEPPKSASPSKLPLGGAEAGTATADQTSGSGNLFSADETEVDDSVAAKPRTMKDVKARRNAETIEDFEETVVDYGRDEGADRAPKAELIKDIGSRIRHTDEAGRRSGLRRGVAHGVPKPGASQEQPIELSDREESSSEEASPAKPASTAPTLDAKPGTVKKERQKPQTPVLLQSSPPVRTKELIDADIARRTTIIGFDSSGPRNQGTLLARKAAAVSAYNQRTSLAPWTVPLGSDGHSALERLGEKRRSGPSSVATSTKTTRTTHTERTVPPSNVADSVEDALASFMTKKKQNGKPPGSASNQKAAAITRQAALTSKPVLNQSFDDDGFTFVDDAPMDEIVSARVPQAKLTVPMTASQRAMPPPVQKSARLGRALRASAEPLLQQAASKQSHEQTLPKQARLKRSLETAVAESVAAKKPKTANESAPEHIKLASKTTTTPERSRRSNTVYQARKSLFAQFVAPTSQCPSRRPSRKASQGVDINGSPIPPDLEVLDNATGLETFTQQAGLSSGDAQPKVRGAINHIESNKPATEWNFTDEMVAIPSCQPQVLSSNEKRRPSAPHEESQAITAIALSRIDPQKLILRGDTALPPTDPFTSSDQARKEPVRGSASSKLAAQLRKHAGGAGRKRRSAAVDNGDDPDETLVELEPARTRTKHSTTGASDVACEDSSSDRDVDEPVIGDWRRALEPHQMNLFDQLVGVSHRLVRHLVDQQTAMREMIYDYRKTGLTLIKQMEAQQAQEYQMALLKLEKRKKELRKGLEQTRARVRASVAEVENGRRERAAKRSDTEGVERALQQMLAHYS